NIVHLLFGVLGVLMARTAALARVFLIGGGLVYALFWLYGLIVDETSDANFVPFNDADDWLHLGLAVGMIPLGLLLPAYSRRRTRLDSAGGVIRDRKSTRLNS